MRKAMIFALLALILWVPARAVENTPDVSAAACVLLHPDSGTVLFERSADEPMLIASTTKVMTALVVLEYCQPDETVTVTREHCGVEGSSMYLTPGGEYTVADLLYGMLLASGNDAALALAEHCAGSVEAFAELMNDAAQALGLQNSHFTNPHGLDSPEHHSSASDLAIIMAAAMENELFRQISGAQSHTVGPNTYYNHNRLLGGCPGVVAGKTGYTRAAGRTLVTCCQRDGMRLICVTLAAPDDWDDHESLYDWAYSSYTDSPVELTGLPGSVAVISGMSDSVELSAASGLRVLRKPDDPVDILCQLPEFVYAPVHSGDELGRVTVSAGGTTVETALLAAEDVPTDPKTPLNRLERFKRALSRANLYSGYYITGY